MCVILILVPRGGTPDIILAKKTYMSSLVLKAWNISVWLNIVWLEHPY